MRGRSDRKPGENLTRRVWGRLLPPEHPEHAPILRLVSARADSLDAVRIPEATPAGWAAPTFSRPYRFSAKINFLSVQPQWSE